ncbi:MAG: haloacid dehalogenase type II [Alphaproteobacteria bacterium]|nr:haloacid dehalogenase type II [Alphaproteobacteria bacterium]
MTGDVKALIFDVFGTVVDWRTSVARMAGEFAKSHGIPEADWVQFACDWRDLYQPAMEKVRSGGLPFTKLDTLYRMNLDEIAEKYGFSHLSSNTLDELNLVWHRLSPWPDSVEGLTMLKSRYIIGTHSNGNIALMVNMAKNGGLPWDVILGAEVVRQYKPVPETYDRCCDALGFAPEQVMMTAAHNNDLAAARARGLKTGFVTRPNEYGPGQTTDLEPSEEWDIVATDFVDLARKMGC